MTRIGFAYNQKPELTSGLSTAVHAARGNDESLGNRRKTDRRNAPSSLPIRERGAIAVASSSSEDDVFAEWDAPETIDAVGRALAEMGEVIRLEATSDFPAMLKDARPDIVFNIAEGLIGPNREAHVPAICEFFGVPYSGSDPFTLSLCLHKARTKQMLAAHGIPTAPFVVIDSDADLQRVVEGRDGRLAGLQLQYPLFVKPVQEGSSKGITEENLVRNVRELEDRVQYLLSAYDQPVIIESFLAGDEFTCAVLGNGRAARVLPIVRMRFDALPDGALPIYGFEAKWVWDTPDRPLDIFECPAAIPTDLRAKIEDVTLRTYHALGCRDWSRIDVRLDGHGAPHVIEVNPLPGILPDPADNSCLPKAARAAGLSYDRLIQACLGHAADRQGVLLPPTPSI